MSRRILILAVIALVWWLSRPGPAEPTPAPQPTGELDLAGAFSGETAADDAAIVAALAGQLAHCIEFDQMTADPVLVSGVALDQLRTRSREFRCDGRILGEQHPELARRVGDYLDRKLGNAGGPVTPEQLSKWVAAYREIERAATRAIR
jgi:hypothetical protein